MSSLDDFILRDHGCTFDGGNKHSGISTIADCTQKCSSDPNCNMFYLDSKNNICHTSGSQGSQSYDEIWNNCSHKTTDSPLYIRRLDIADDISQGSATQLSNDAAYLTNMLKKINEKLSSGKNNKQQIVALTEAQDAISSALEDSISQIQGQIHNTYSTTQAQQQMLGNVSTDITGKQERAMQQAMDIEQKQALMNTRNRMLELSMEKNIYKRKVIYTILALILAVIVMLVAGYVTFNKA